MDDLAESSTPSSSFAGSRFTWTIANFSRFNSKMYSDVFEVGGYKWRILIYPKGNNVDHLSIYLDVADSSVLPYGWSRYAQFSISVINQNPQQSVRKDTAHKFNTREVDWGFTSFIPISDVHDPNKGFLLNDALVIEAEVVVPNNSRSKTGYAGLQNQGTTSYMNSLLQTLYHIPYFRKAVYHMPTTEKDIPSRSITLALQNLFYELQYSKNSVATKDITQSFESDTHDVQELNRVLCEKLEQKMKGTVVEGTMQQLFEGHHMNYIECNNVNYKSTRKESFYDLQLDVKGCQDVYASLDKFVNVERLEGDNKYHTEQHGLQDAKKGVLFIDFPPVLQLQLKRFEYDLTRDTMVKINDRYEFPLELDLDKENGKYLSPDADKSVRNLYTLHSVLVHSGGEHGGRYYAFIRPTLSEKWFKFDDDRVTEEDMNRALQEQFGGEEEVPQTNTEVNDTPFKFTKFSNAYMLVYIRKSDIERIICNVDQQDIAKHVQVAHLYTTIKVTRSEDLIQQIGGDVYFDLVDHDKVCCFRVKKEMPFCNFKEEVAMVFGVPVKFQRFWRWAERQNHTYRPHRPLTPEEETQSVGQFKEVLNKDRNAELKLFLEVELGPNMQPIQPPSKTKEDILIFFKLYDPVKEQLSYAGRLFVKVNGCPSEILTKLNVMAGFPSSQDIELFEEIKFEPSIMCEKIDKNLSFRSSQLEDGDIVCFQKSLSIENRQQYRYPDVPSFLEYVHNNQVRLKEEHKKKARAFLTIKVARNEDLIKQIGSDIHFDLVDHEKVRHFHVQKKMPFCDFKEEVAKEFGIPVKFQRFWLWAKRQNHTYRPHRPLTPEEERQSVGQLRETTNKANLGELKLFLEVELGQDLHPIQPPKKAKEDILIFVKLYDPMKQEIRYVGRLFVKSSGRPTEIVTKLNVMAGFSCNQEIELYEEIKFEPSVMCEPINDQLTFGENQIEDGDILCFQKSRSVETEQQHRCPDVPSFFQYMHNLQVVHFRLLEKPKEDVFHLQLSKLSSYEELVEQVASQLGVSNTSKIRLTSHNSSSQQPKPFPIKYRSKDHLSDMLVHCNQFSAILYYEVLNIPQDGESNERKPSQCVICLDATVEGACIPCGHMAGCMTCLKDIKDKKWGCPICRAKIQQVIKIYTV